MITLNLNESPKSLSFWSSITSSRIRCEYPCTWRRNNLQSTFFQRLFFSLPCHLLNSTKLMKLPNLQPAGSRYISQAWQLYCLFISLYQYVYTTGLEPLISAIGLKCYGAEQCKKCTSYISYRLKRERTVQNEGKRENLTCL